MMKNSPLLLPLLVDALPLSVGFTGHAGKHVLDLRHVGHDVLHQYQWHWIVHLTLALLPQDFLVTSETNEKELVRLFFQN